MIIDWKRAAEHVRQAKFALGRETSTLRLVHGGGVPSIVNECASLDAAAKLCEREEAVRALLEAVQFEFGAVPAAHIMQMAIRVLELTPK